MKSSEAMILTADECNLSNCIEKPEKFRTSMEFDLVLPVRFPNQLSYEATHCESWSFVCSNVPMIK